MTHVIGLDNRAKLASILTGRLSVPAIPLRAHYLQDGQRLPWRTVWRLTPHHAAGPVVLAFSDWRMATAQPLA